jgi:hypothetical protein
MAHKPPHWYSPPVNHERGDDWCSEECSGSDRLHLDDKPDHPEVCPKCGGSGYACRHECVQVTKARVEV